MAQTTPQATPAAPTAPVGPADKQGLCFDIARSYDQVQEAWELVYGAYCRSGLIPANPHRIHTAPQALGDRSVVVVGSIKPVIVSTLTAILDGPQGVPLDRVYRKELDSLRDQGRLILEFGLFADRRRDLARTAEAIFELMRFVFFFGVHHEVTDYIMGVHPRHARFYCRTFGFKVIGEPKSYAAVNNRPVVLMYGDFLNRFEEVRKVHAIYRHFFKNPVDAQTFDQRYRFPAAEISGSRIDRFLHDGKRPAPAKNADAPSRQAG